MIDSIIKYIVQKGYSGQPVLIQLRAQVVSAESVQILTLCHRIFRKWREVKVGAARTTSAHCVSSLVLHN
jgi:hypothetical protein